MPLENKKYLKQQEVAEILNVRTQTLNQWRCSQKQQIPYIKVGRVILYPEQAFYSWLESHQNYSSDGGFQ